MTTEVKLYRFVRGPLVRRYTNVGVVVAHAGEDYLPGGAISHSEIEDGGDRNKVGITITMPPTLEITEWWWPWPPLDLITVTIITLEDGVPNVDWMNGRLLQPKREDGKFTIRSEPSATKSRRSGKGRKFQRGCDLVHYSQGRGLCNVDPLDHLVPATIGAVSGLVITSAAYLALPLGRFAGGFIEWTRTNGLRESRGIEAHTGNAIRLDFGHEDLVVGLELDSYPGCGGSWEDCEYYENTDNYGGNLYMPGRNFYDGNPVRSG